MSFIATILAAAIFLQEPKLEIINTQTLWSGKYDEVVFRDLNGKELKFKEIKNKIIFINYWATWCPYCVKEMPHIEKLWKKFEKENDIIFLCVSSEELKVIKSFAKNRKINMPVYQITENSLPLNVDALPTTYIIPPNSDTAYYSVGYADWDNKNVVAKLNSLIDQLKKLKTPP